MSTWLKIQQQFRLNGHRPEEDEYHYWLNLNKKDWEKWNNTVPTYFRQITDVAKHPDEK